jgi:hypothetical protein
LRAAPFSALRHAGVLAAVGLIAAESVAPLEGAPEAPPIAASVTVRANVRVSARGGPFVENCIAAHPEDSGLLLVSSSEVTEDGILAAAFASEDGGRTWSLQDLPGMREGLANHNWVHALDTWATFAADGTAYLSTLAAKRLDDGRWQTPILFYRSGQRGRGWEGPVLLPGTSFDRPSLVAGRGAVFLSAAASGQDPSVVREALKTDVLAVLRSDDGGHSFQIAGHLATDNLGHNTVNTALMADGSLLLAYYDHPRNEGQQVTGGRLYVVRFADRGTSPGAPQFVASAPRSSNPGFVAVDRTSGPFRGRVYAAWEAGALMYVNADNVRSPSNVGKSREVAVASSTDGGARWSRPVILAVPDQGPAYYATVAVSREGVVGVFWLQHERADPERLCYRVYFCASTDGGLTFTTPHAVSDRVSCPDAAPNVAASYPPSGEKVFERFPRGGDYLGLAAGADGAFHAAWSDARDGLFQVYTARIDVTRSGPSSERRN